MNNRTDQISQYLRLLGIKVDEDDFFADLDEIADLISDVFWEEMYRDNRFDDAVSVADDTLDDQLEDLSYIAEKHEMEEGWDESEDYGDFRELVRDEVFERAELPEDELEAQERMEENTDESDNTDEDENS